jgi:ribosomal protein S18 acetylase RimI-like enzyme
MTTDFEYRSELVESDITLVTQVTRETGFFSPEELDIAQELVTLNVTQGAEKSGYFFLIQDEPDGIVGYACYGPIPGTQTSFDLYWIVVSPKVQGQGVGRALVRAVERHVVAKGGRRLYADTSSRSQYAPTRAFYERAGFEQAAYLEHFYSEGDGKVIFVRKLEDAI